MTLPLSIPALFASAAAGYPIARSIRFNANVNAYLSRTFNVGGNTTNWTASFWVKRTKFDVMQRIFTANSNPAAFADASYTGICSFNTTNNMSIAGGGTAYRSTAAFFRDPSAWLHVVVDANFVVYVNGVSQTFTTNVNPTLRPFNTAISHYIGQSGGTPPQFNETYLAEMNFVDGQNLPPTAFGLTDPITGVWSPKRYSGNYGTTGFYLPFTDNSSNAALGKDFSGMSNLITVSDNFSSPVWGLGNYGVITAGQGDPLGGAGAYKLAVGSSTAHPYLYSGFSFVAGQATTFSIYVKAGGQNDCVIVNGHTNGGVGTFNITSGSGYVAATNAQGTGSNVSAAIEDAGNGWYKCSVTATHGVTGDELNYFHPGTSTVNGIGIYVFRANMVSGSNVPRELQYTNGAAVLNKDFSVYNITANDWNNDCLVDTPTNYGVDTGVGGEMRGNYCVFNPLDTHIPSYMISHNGNLEPQNLVNGVWTTTRATMFVSSGKWYWENVASLGAEGLMMVGIMGQGTYLAGRSDSVHLGQVPDGYAYFNVSPGYKYNNNSGVAYGAPYAANDVLGVAFDADAGAITFYKNGVSQGVAYSGIPMNVPYAPAISLYQANSSGAYAFGNFGQRPMSYPGPAGYKALCAQNIPTPAVVKSSEHFDVHLRTGTNAPFSVSGKGFSPDLVWSKSRASVENHGLWDSVRGATLELFTPANAAEATLPSGISSFDATGYSANIGTWPRLNAAGISLVEWLWNKSPTAGFNILTYVKSATTNQAVAHGLGAVPTMIMVRQRNGGDIYFWHKSLTGTEYLDVCTTIARTTNAGIFYQAPDSSNFYLGNAWGGSGAANHVAWVWAEVPGFSRFGTYYGNGVVDGPFVWTGFRPKWLLRKRLDVTANWWAQDGVRSPINPTNNLSALNLTDTEFVTTYETDFLANGFKVRNTSNNQAGGLYLFAAFAENPFKYARAR